MIPILFEHKQDKVVGHFDDGTITMLPGFELEKDQIFRQFGNIGIQVEEFLEDIKTGKKLIRRFKIFAFSIDRDALKPS